MAPDGRSSSRMMTACPQTHTSTLRKTCADQADLLYVALFSAQLCHHYKYDEDAHLTFSGTSSIVISETSRTVSRLCLSFGPEKKEN